MLEAERNEMEAQRGRVKMKKIGLASRIIFLVLVFCSFLSPPLHSQIRKYQVIVPKVNLHLEPNENSPVVISVPAGEILAQASAVRALSEIGFLSITSFQKRENAGRLCEGANAREALS